nr:coat protein [Actinidia yellowing ringspot virus]BDI54509.1 coat protein [Actinidia yellowing ringspot virus]
MKLGSIAQPITSLCEMEGKSSTSQPRKSRQNARSTQFAQQRAAARKQAAPGQSEQRRQTARLDWERRGPGALDVIQRPHQWVCKAEGDIVGTNSDTFYTVDLYEYIKDYSEFPTRFRGFVIMFESKLDGAFCFVQKKGNAAFKDEFSSLNSFKIEKNKRYGVQLIAPDNLTFSSFTSGKFAFVVKFDTPMKSGEIFFTRKVWGQSDKLPEVLIPANCLRD